MNRIAGESTFGRIVVIGAAVFGAVAMAGCTTKVINGGEGDGGVPWSALGNGNATAAPAPTGLCEAWSKDNPDLANQMAKDILGIISSQILKNHTAPGATVVAGCGERRLVIVGAGTTRFGGGKAVKAGETLYDLASVQKPITSATFMRLETLGKVDRKKLVSTYLPAYTGGTKSGVTVDQLQSHTSGLPSEDETGYGPVMDGATSKQQAQKNLLAQAPTLSPGKHRYSNFGYALLGMAASGATGQPFEVVMDGTILSPLGMQNTMFNPPASSRTCAPTSPDADQKEILTCVPQDRLARIQDGVSGHAGLFATAEDLGKFAAMLANKGNVNGQQILTPEQVAEMATPRPGSTYGLGFRINIGNAYSKQMSESAFGHTGWSGTSFEVDPVTGMWVVVLTNDSLSQQVDGKEKNNVLTRYRTAIVAINDAVAAGYKRALTASKR